MASLTQRMVGAMQVDVRTFEEIESDPTAVSQAVVVILISGFAALLGNIFRAGPIAGVSGMIMTLVGYAVWTLIVVVVGTKLMPEPSTRATFAEAFRVIGFAASPGVFNVLMIIPFLGRLISMLISIWILVVMVVAVRSVLDYTSTARAVIVCLIGGVALLILFLLILFPMMLTMRF